MIPPRFLALAAALLTAAVALGADTKKPAESGKETPKKEAPKAPAKSAAKEEAKPMHLPLKGTVISISSRSLKLNGAEGKEDRTFKINKATEILSGAKAAKIEDVKPGAEVTGSFVREGDSDTVTKLQLKPAPKKE